MPVQTRLGHSSTKRKTSGRLLMRLTYPTELIIPANGEYDFGNIVSWKRNNKTDRVEHHKSANGVRMVDYEETGTLKFGYQFMCDEHLQLATMLRQKGKTGGATATTIAGTGITATFTGVDPGAVYNLGRYNVRSVVVTVAASTKVQGVDYEVDALTGRIRILATGSIIAGDNVSVTFNCEVGLATRYLAGTLPRMEGYFTFFEYSQWNYKTQPPVLFEASLDGPVAEHKWYGSVWISDEGDNNLQGFNQFTVECTCHQAPDIIEFAQPGQAVVP